MTETAERLLAERLADAVMDTIEQHGRINRDDLILAMVGEMARRPETARMADHAQQRPEGDLLSCAGFWEPPEDGALLTDQIKQSMDREQMRQAVAEPPIVVALQRKFGELKSVWKDFAPPQRHIFPIWGTEMIFEWGVTANTGDDCVMGSVKGVTSLTWDWETGKRVA